MGENGDPKKGGKKILRKMSFEPFNLWDPTINCQTLRSRPIPIKFARRSTLCELIAIICETYGLESISELMFAYAHLAPINCLYTSGPRIGAQMRINFHICTPCAKYFFLHSRPTDRHQIRLNCHICTHSANELSIDTQTPG